MKKRFLFPVITSLALLFALTGCNTPISDVKLDVDETENVNNPALPGPANVKADAREGIIIVTWDQVKDAKSYQVYRKDDKTGVVKEYDGSSTTPGYYFIDTVSVDNQLVDGHSYTYTVVSVSGKSPNTRAVITQDDVIWNGQSSTTVIAKIPDRLDDASLKTWITLDPAKIDIVHKGYLSEKGVVNEELVTWPVEPNLSYAVKVLYGSAPLAGYVGKELALYDSYSAKRGSDPFDPLGYATLPTIGGTNTIQITTTFKNGTGYYATADKQYKVLPSTYDVIPAPENFIASRENQTNTVVLQWKNVAAATVGADGYAVYRIEYSEASNVETVGTWSLVTLSNLESVDNTWYARDTAALAEKTYKYFVIAKKDATAASYPSEIVGVQPIVVATPELDVQVLKTATYGSTDTSVQITWTQGTGTGGFTGAANTLHTNYKLSRAEIELYDSENGIPDFATIAEIEDAKDYAEKNNVPYDGPEYDPNMHLVGPFVDVPLIAAQIQQGKAVVTETIGTAASATTAAIPLKARTYYVYKLEQIGAGSVSSEPVYGILAEEGAFSKLVRLSVTANEKPQVDKHKTVTLRIADAGSAYLGDITSIKVYRRDYRDSNAQTAYPVTANKELSVTADKITTKGFEAVWEDTNVVISGNTARYEYKVVAYNAAGEVYNAYGDDHGVIRAHAAWAQYTNVRVSDPDILAPYVWNNTTNTNDTYVSERVTLVFSGDYLTGAPLIKVAYRGKTVNEYQENYNYYDEDRFEADKAFAGGPGNPWTEISGTGITIETVPATADKGTVWQYVFPATHNFELGKVYQIRVNAGWAQETGTVNKDKDFEPSYNNTLNQAYTVMANGNETVRTGYIEVADYDIDGTYSDGTKGITLKSNYIKWSGTPTIAVHSKLKNPPATDRPYSSTDFTIGGLQAVYEPVNGPNLNGKTFEKPGTINIPYAERNDVLYYITVTGGGYKGAYDSRNNGGILQNPSNPVTADFGWRTPEIARLTPTTAKLTFYGTNLNGGVVIRSRVVGAQTWSAPVTPTINAVNESTVNVVAGNYEFQYNYSWAPATDWTPFDGSPIN